MKSYHDYHLFGYRVDGEKRELQFDVAWLYPEDPNPRPRETVTFRKVEGYFLEHDLGVNILYAIEEVDIVEHINSKARFFEEQAKWGWPAFWKTSAERTIEYLKGAQAQCYQLTTSYGLCGWVICQGPPDAKSWNVEQNPESPWELKQP